ncbi:MAG TPA: hypothetical protein VMB50_19570 [Myxococcales bacterium]|nr:hypothetical protein [Myxococcales bacterium]
MFVGSVCEASGEGDADPIGFDICVGIEGCAESRVPPLPMDAGFCEAVLCPACIAADKRQLWALVLACASLTPRGFGCDHRSFFPCLADAGSPALRDPDAGPPLSANCLQGVLSLAADAMAQAPADAG